MAGAILLGARKVGSAEYVAPTNYIKLTATVTLTPSGIGYNLDIDAVGSGWNVRRLAIDPPILYVRAPGVAYNIVECVWELGYNYTEYLKCTCSYGTFYVNPPDNPNNITKTPQMSG